MFHFVPFVHLQKVCSYTKSTERRTLRVWARLQIDKMTGVIYTVAHVRCFQMEGWKKIKYYIESLILSCLRATFVFINPVIDVCVVHARERNHELRSPPNHARETPPTEPRATDWLVYVIWLVPPPNLCLVTLAAANSTASSSSSNLPASARPRLVRQRHDYLLPLHDPYGPGLSLSEFGDLVRHSLAIGLDSPPSENPEAGQVPTRRRPRSIRGRVGNWWEFILQLIRLTFFWVQMGLPSVYFQRVASLIQKSDISMAELASIQRRGTMDGLLRMIILVGGFSVPEFAKVVGVPPVQRFKKNWEAFAMRYREEWSNLNVISTLLLR